MVQKVYKRKACPLSKALPLGELARERLEGRGQHDRAAAQR